MAETISADGPRAASLADADEVCRLDARQLALAYASGSLSPVEVTHSVLKRAELVQARFNAFTRLDSERRAGSSAPFGTKMEKNRTAFPGGRRADDDQGHTLGQSWPVSYGSNTVDDLACATDAPAVAPLRHRLSDIRFREICGVGERPT
ncbi:hypothetical protein [Aminobacter sp. MET-1]|uniref:hypothetical protein n=1 Tax=Aminobacter sp. MET-1 TaxID=2951085 RepID=UPI00226A27E7|nr:hypothetical protein [Aminobacter sp. MET-1]MCX8568504.1 hypothetical protein [Aminobacter sp. MET-1]